MTDKKYNQECEHYWKETGMVLLTATPQTDPPQIEYQCEKCGQRKGISETNESMKQKEKEAHDMIERHVTRWMEHKHQEREDNQ
jgi:hypothetical protein